MAKATLLALGAGIVAVFALVSVTTASAATATVPAGDFWFCDESFHLGVCTTTVQQGDTVVWDFAGSLEPHTTTECGASCDSPTASPLWESGFVEPGEGPFSFTFNTPGTYLYVCRVHPFDMRGRIVVEAAVGDGPSPTVAPGGGTDGPAPTAAPVASDGLPPAGSGPQSGSQSGWPLVALAVAGAGLSAAGLALARGRGAQ
jgi:plastocyanin